MRYYAGWQSLISCMIQNFILNVLVLTLTDAANYIRIPVHLQLFYLLIAASTMNKKCANMQSPLFGIENLYEFISLINIKLVNDNLNNNQEMRASLPKLRL